MAGIPYHPAPGLGDMLPGWFDVPMNPVTAQRGVTVQPGIGDILPGHFVVPQNPILDAVTGNVKPLATGAGKGGVNAPPGVGLTGVGCGCGCGGSGGCGGHGGMGAISTDLSNIATDIGAGQWSQAGTDFMTFLTEPTVAGIPLWIMGIGIFFLAQMVSSHQVSFHRRGASY